MYIRLSSRGHHMCGHILWHRVRHILEQVASGRETS